MRYSRGDTIIEVMFSFVVFSLLDCGDLIVMNRGTQIAQRSSLKLHLSASNLTLKCPFY